MGNGGSEDTAGQARPQETTIKRPAWLENQQQTTFKQDRYNSVLQAQFTQNALRGRVADPNSVATPSNEGTGQSGWVTGAEAGTLSPMEYGSSETSLGEAALKQARLEEAARTEEGIKGARARFRLITSTANNKLYHAVIVLIIAGLLAFKFFGH